MFSIDLSGKAPIYEQLYKKITELIIKGALHENDQLPGVRTLAKELGVNPNTVAKAYAELDRNGITYSVPGKGSFVAPVNRNLLKEKTLAEFDRAAKEALKAGITKEELSARITNLHND